MRNIESNSNHRLSSNDGVPQVRFILRAIAVYGTALLIGLCVVSFPASGVYLMRELDMSPTDYGAIFLPQLATTIIGALVGAFAVGRMPMRFILGCTLLCFLLAEFALVYSVHIASQHAIVILMLGTGIFGFGFGFGGGPINGMAGQLFPNKGNAAILSLHGFAGVGFTCAPFLFGFLIEIDAWSAGPVLLMAASGVLVACALIGRLSDGPRFAPGSSQLRGIFSDSYFKVAAAIVFVYSLAEGALANWIIPFLEKTQGFGGQSAALALSMFWGALTAGRLFAALFLANMSPSRILIGLSIILAVILPTILLASSLADFILIFTIAGFGCSACFPALVALSSRYQPEKVSVNAAILTGIMMAGTGIGAFGTGVLLQRISLDTLLASVAVLPLVILFILVSFNETEVKPGGVDKLTHPQSD